MLRTSRAVIALALTAAAVVATGAPAGAWRSSDLATRAVRNAAEAAPTWTLTVNVEYVDVGSDPPPMTMSRLTPTTAEGSQEADLPTPIELLPGDDTYTTTRIVNETQGDVEALTICAGGAEPACTSFGFFFDAGNPLTSKWWVQAWGPGNDQTLDPINYLPYYDYRIGKEASMSVYASGAHTLQLSIGT